MANMVFPSFQLNESDHDLRDHETIWRTKQDHCGDMDEAAFMDLFSSQENASCDAMQGMNMVGVEPPRSESSKDVREKQRLRRPRGEDDTKMKNRLSMEEILMVAGEKFIQFSTNRIDGISMLIHPYGSSITGLCLDDERDVEIMHSLLSAAENVGLKQLETAARLVARCQQMASESGTPVQRLASYFYAALQQKISRELYGVAVSRRKADVDDHKGLALGTNNAFLASHQQLPFSQVTEFVGMQAVIEQVRGCGKVHLIDLQIRSGIQWTALMQGLTDSPLQRLRITAVGTADQTYMEETGSRLQSFAESLNLPLLFEVVYLQGMDAFNEDLFNIEPDETVAVYSMLMLRSMISKPKSLETVMKGIARMRPAVMVVSEVEANHNSPSFIDRFTEALLFYSAYFDCLEECMERRSEYRAVLEGRFFGEGITNIVGAEEEERVTRNVKLGVWRKYFTRFGMTEMALSDSSKYQASLVLEQFGKGRCCDLVFDGKGLIVGWKGTPIQSVTAWKFS
ncbi:DELLA protein GAIP-like [Salvia miltiorrhiza]|uniref:DELLA protein GAIP-like n=1 Tax=Salvia miltiorrhiza TaxID=226208 RepID=UPI0025AB924D|nr:DELLA protein GAIP-like [Salvia miltiorrhiza]